MKYCNDIIEVPALYSFVLNQCWSTPGTLCIEQRKFKKTKSLDNLINEFGYYGPILDMVIRSTATTILIQNFGADTKSITGNQRIKGTVQGSILKRFITKICNDYKSIDSKDDLSESIEKWFSNKVFIEDYETLYRNTRASILNSQIVTLRNGPHKIVSTYY